MSFSNDEPRGNGRPPLHGPGSGSGSGFAGPSGAGAPAGAGSRRASGYAGGSGPGAGSGSGSMRSVHSLYTPAEDEAEEEHRREDRRTRDFLASLDPSDIGLGPAAGGSGTLGRSGGGGGKPGDRVTGPVGRPNHEIGSMFAEARSITNKYKGYRPFRHQPAPGPGNGTVPPTRVGGDGAGSGGGARARRSSSLRGGAPEPPGAGRRTPASGRAGASRGAGGGGLDADDSGSGSDGEYDGPALSTYNSSPGKAAGRGANGRPGAGAKPGSSGSGGLGELGGSLWGEAPGAHAARLTGRVLAAERALAALGLELDATPQVAESPLAADARARRRAQIYALNGLMEQSEAARVDAFRRKVIADRAMA